MAKRQCLLTGVELRSMGSKGIGLVATSPLAIGTVPIQERPYATSLLPQCGGPVTCRTCFGSINAATKGLQSCRRCGAVYYCSYKCSSLDRRPHRDSGECWLYEHAAGLSLAAPPGLQQEAVLALRHIAATTSARPPPPPPPSGPLPLPLPPAAGTAPTAPDLSTSPPPLSFHPVLLAPESQLEREVAGWQAAAIRNMVLRPRREEEAGDSGGDAEEEAEEGRLKRVELAAVAAVAKAAGLGPGLGLLGAVLARAAAAGRAAAAAHQRALQRRALRKQQREQRQEERKRLREEKQGQATMGAGATGGEEAAAAAVEGQSAGKPSASSSSESSYESLSSSDDGIGTVTSRRDRCRYPQSRPSAEDTLRSVLQLQSVLTAWPCSNTSGGKADSTDGDVGGCGTGWQHLIPRADQSNVRPTAAAAAAAAVAAAARAMATVLNNAIEVALHPPFAAGLIGAGRMAGGGSSSSSAAASSAGPLAMYRRTCLLNHSCRPTAAYHFRPGGQLFLRLIADLDAGTEVTVSYIDLALPRNRRRAQLYDKYGFTCGCERCSNGDGSAAASAAANTGAACGTSPPAAPTAFTVTTALTADELLSSYESLHKMSTKAGEVLGSAGGDSESRRASLAVKGTQPMCSPESALSCLTEMEKSEAHGDVADADCSFVIQLASIPCPKADMVQENADAISGGVWPATTSLAAGRAAGEGGELAGTSTYLSLEQRLQLLVRDCGDLLLQQQLNQGMADATMAAESTYTTLVHGLDELLAEAHSHSAAGSHSLERGGNGATNVQDFSGVVSGNVSFHPQHAACLDAYSLLASAARRCARAAATAAEAEAEAEAAATASAAAGDECETSEKATEAAMAMVGWWARAVCASLAGAAAAERLLAADPALLQLAAASWSDVASTACEMLSALFGLEVPAMTTDCRPAAAAAAATTTTSASRTATSAPTPADTGLDAICGPCAQLHEAWNPSKAILSARPAAEQPSGTGAPGSSGGIGSITWSRSAMVTAIKAALAEGHRELEQRSPRSLKPMQPPPKHAPQRHAAMTVPPPVHQPPPSTPYQEKRRHHGLREAPDRDSRSHHYGLQSNIWGYKTTVNGHGAGANGGSGKSDGRSNGWGESGLMNPPSPQRCSEPLSWDAALPGLGSLRPPPPGTSPLDPMHQQRLEGEGCRSRANVFKIERRDGARGDSERWWQQQQRQRHVEEWGRELEKSGSRDDEAAAPEGIRERGCHEQGEREWEREGERERGRERHELTRDVRAGGPEHGKGSVRSDRSTDRREGRDRDPYPSSRTRLDSDGGLSRDGAGEYLRREDRDRGHAGVRAGENGRSQWNRVYGMERDHIRGRGQDRNGSSDRKRALDGCIYTHGHRHSDPKRAEGEGSWREGKQEGSPGRDLDSAIRAERRRPSPSPERQRRRRQLEVEGSENAKRRPQLAATETSSLMPVLAADDAGGGRDDRNCGSRNLLAAAPRVQAEGAAEVPPGVCWRRYTAPEGTAVACGAFFRMCRSLGGKQAQSRRHVTGTGNPPTVAAVTAAAMDDWLHVYVAYDRPLAAMSAVVPVVYEASAAADSLGLTESNTAAHCRVGRVAKAVGRVHEQEGRGNAVVEVQAAAVGAIAAAAAHSLARVHLLLRLLLGEAHGACEAAQFLPFFVQHIPYDVAAELTQLANALLNQEHLPLVPMYL